MVVRTSSGMLAWMVCACLPGWLTGKVPEDKGNGKGEVDKREAKGKGERTTGRAAGDIGSACISL